MSGNENVNIQVGNSVTQCDHPGCENHVSHPCEKCGSGSKPKFVGMSCGSCMYLYYKADQKPCSACNRTNYGRGDRWKIMWKTNTYKYVDPRWDF